MPLTLDQLVTDLLETEHVIMEPHYLGSWGAFVETMDAFNELPSDVRHGGVMELHLVMKSSDMTIPKIKFSSEPDSKPLTRKQTQEILGVLEGVFANSWGYGDLYQYWKDEKRQFGQE